MEAATVVLDLLVIELFFVLVLFVPREKTTEGVAIDVISVDFLAATEDATAVLSFSFAVVLLRVQ